MEGFHTGQRVASSRRSDHQGHPTPRAEHRPQSHRHYQAGSPERFVRWAEKAGPATAKLLTQGLASRRHPQPAYRSGLGLRRLGKSYGEDRLEAACRRALTLSAHSFKRLESLLKHALDNTPAPEQGELARPSDPDTIRGPSYDP